MTKLNELSDNPGSTKERMRIGRGRGSGKGKTGGRGVKGQKARTGHGMNGFEGGQMPLHMRMPKRGFNSLNRPEYAEVNLWRIAQAIEAGRLDGAAAIDADALVKAGVIRRARDGVKLLGEGAVTSALNITCHAATAGARAAVEAAGGVLTTTKPAAAPAGA